MALGSLVSRKVPTGSALITRGACSLLEREKLFFSTLQVDRRLATHLESSLVTCGGLALQGCDQILCR